MASHRKLDAAGGSQIRLSLIFLATCVVSASGQAPPVPNIALIEQLFRNEQWAEIAKFRVPAGASPDLDFYYGSALAHLGRWNEAQAALESGFHASHSDTRFPTEIAGVAFKQNRYAEAETWLKRALRLAPGDEYVNNFLATIYFLQRNLEAALKYWNRIGKPEIELLTYEPIPRLSPVLLDHAFAFSSASELRFTDLLTTEARLNQLKIFQVSLFQLQARPDEKFDLTFHAMERNGCGQNKWECSLLILGGTPAQTLNFNYFNIRRQAINVRSLFRWDAEKRWAFAELETPLLGMPKWHLQLGADFRNENWAIRNSFSGPSPLLAALNLKKQTAFAGFTDVVSGKWQWSARTEFSHRAYNDVLTGTVLTPQLLSTGAQLKQTLTSDYTLLRIPDRRLTLDTGMTAEASRLWSGEGRDYAKFSGKLRLHWFPQLTGDRYELEHTIRVAGTAGDPPFDELFMFGVLGDSTLPMRAHIATRNGKKGAAPLGRDYFLSNWDATRSFSILGLLKVKVGPFVDTGAISDQSSALGSHKWLWDAGLEGKLRVLGFEVALSYGRDLRSGKNAVLARTP
jgi:tetratricopeptide (TPR) repeat protein